MKWEELKRRRDFYKQYQCDALAWADNKDKALTLILYRDSTQKMYFAKLDIELVRRIRKWTEEYIQRQEGRLEGYQ